jgi:TldD protein
MEAVLREVLEAAARAGADAAEARIERALSRTVAVRNREVESVIEEEDAGFGVSVFAGGCEGFASSPSLESDAIRSAAERAMDAARASAVSRANPHAPRLPETRGEWRTPIREDALARPIAEHVDLLRAAAAACLGRPKIALSRASLGAWRYERLYGSSGGARIAQTVHETGAELRAFAREMDEVECRSYPTSLFHYRAGGQEVVDEMDLVSHAEEICDEAARLLASERCPKKRTTVLIGPYMMMLQIHESIGHPLELDRVFGDEKGFAGASFATPDRLGAKYGSPLMHVVVDPTMPSALGGYAWDDEGTVAAPRTVIDGGVLVDYLSNRESAERLRKGSTASMRCVGWKHKPIVRMSNLSLSAGDATADDLVAGIEDGIEIEHSTSGSIDDNRLNFQFGAEIAWEIKDGRRTGKLYRRPSYAGRTPEFWASLDGLGDRSTWRLGGTPTCGKGQPLQIAHVSHGSPIARFRDVEVGV